MAISISSPTDIGNLALDLLAANNVQDIDSPTSATEILIHRWYSVVRQKILREHPWNFATKRAVLSASTTAPAFGYSSQYPLPNDFLRLNSVSNANNDIIAATEYEIENGNILYNGDGGRLYLKYIYDLTNVAQMDALFVDLFAIDLALSLSYKFTASNTDITRLNGLREKAATQAKAIDGQERPPQVRQYSKILAGRFSLSNQNYYYHFS